MFVALLKVRGVQMELDDADRQTNALIPIRTIGEKFVRHFGQGKRRISNSLHGEQMPAASRDLRRVTLLPEKKVIDELIQLHQRPKTSRLGETDLRKQRERETNVFETIE